MKAPAITLLCLLLASCATRREVITEQVPIVVRDTLTRVETRLDSVRVIERVERAGDTVHHWHATYRERRVTDTLRLTRTDTLTLTRTRESVREVERSPRWWQTALQWAGGAALALILALALPAAIRLLRPR